jgi:hypothetical protein
VGLAAAAGIKGRAIERDFVAIDRCNNGIKLFEIGVGMIQDFSHGHSPQNKNPLCPHRDENGLLSRYHPASRSDRSGSSPVTIITASRLTVDDTGQAYSQDVFGCRLRKDFPPGDHVRLPPSRIR